MKGWVFAAILVLAAASAACGGEGDAPAAPTSTPSPAATHTPPPTPSPSPSPKPEVIAGIPVVPLEVAGEAEFPDDVVLIVETGCWQCDGPTTGLERVYRDPSGELTIETLFSPDHLGLPPRVMQTAKGPQEDRPIITGFALGGSGARIAVSVCTRGECALMGGPAHPGDETTLFESHDGGVTWKTQEVLAGKYRVLGITQEGVILYDQGASLSGSQPKNRFEVYPSRESMEPPESGQSCWPYVLRGHLVWSTEDGRILRADGSEFLALDLPPSARIIDLAVQREPAPQTAVVWFEEEGASGSYYLGLVGPEGRFRKVYRTGGLALLGDWLGPLVYGNTGVESERLAVPSPQFYLGWFPAALDLQGGTAAPILEPFLESHGRNVVQAALEGPFARVVGTGSCLNVREEAGLAAKIIDCAADGVLLRDSLDTVFESGLTWVHVIAPSGRAGWVAADYLER